MTGLHRLSFIPPALALIAGCTSVADEWCRRAADECNLVEDRVECRKRVEGYWEDRENDPPTGVPGSELEERCETQLERCLEQSTCCDFQWCMGLRTPLGEENEDASALPAPYDCHPFVMEPVDRGRCTP